MRSINFSLFLRIFCAYFECGLERDVEAFVENHREVPSCRDRTFGAYLDCGLVREAESYIKNHPYLKAA